MKKRKNNEDNFLLGDEALIAAFGKEAIEDLKKNDYKGYCILRNNRPRCPQSLHLRYRRKKHRTADQIQHALR